MTRDVTDSPRFRLPHPLILLLIGVAVAAALTWILPAGEFERRDDPVTHRSVVVAGTYHAVPRAPVGPFAAIVAIPRGFVEAADVIAVVLFVGGAWVVVDRIGLLGRLVGWLVGAFRQRGLDRDSVLSVFFATMGALENMQEEIIPLVPVLLVLGRGTRHRRSERRGNERRRGDDRQRVRPDESVSGRHRDETGAIAAGVWRDAAHPYCSSIALILWIAFTMRHALTPSRRGGRRSGRVARCRCRRRMLRSCSIVLAPMARVRLRLDRARLGLQRAVGGVHHRRRRSPACGADLASQGTTVAYLEGMQGLLPAAVLIGVARSISLVLADGHVIDTILQQLATPLANLPATVAALLMVPAQAIVHVPVPSVSGQAVLTMPVFVPLSDLLGISRQVDRFGISDGRGPRGAAHPDQRCAHGGAARRRRSVFAVDALRDRWHYASFSGRSCGNAVRAAPLSGDQA